ncbi:helix-turn-helix domain-containing protein [Aequorivita sp. SDUM287046]|uniref:Helix-turn-helix domain-containing protein n=1 Tax=Aequorivita aurantiaca TaxID=3053356 RepID=A0ABT8DJJ0_9FLAO|nr:helix-turn-helix domain-containing protein [Aequorivita aurantiaca]MDN3725203.1 helix-turn-helix domain-containing protein [Aequorivita aurantiaca]
MKNHYLIYTWLLFFGISAISQEEYDYQNASSYFQLLTLSENNPSEALRLADSLANNSTSSKDVIEAKMISATIYEKDGDFENAILFAFESLEKSFENNFNFSRATAEIFLAKQFRMAGYSIYGEKFLNRAEETVLSLPNSDLKLRIKGEWFLEKGQFLLNKKKYLEALHSFRLATDFFLSYESNSKLQNILLKKTTYLLGYTNLKMEKFEEAFINLDRSLLYSQLNHPYSKICQAMIYNGYANLYFEMDDYHNSEKYFIKATTMLENANSNAAKIKVYADALKFFKCNNEIESVYHYSEKYLSVIASMDREMVGVMESDFWEKEEKLYARKPIARYAFVAAIALIGFVTFYKKNSFFNKLIKRNGDKNKDIPKKQPAHREYLPPETVDILLEKLDEFEKKKKYLNQKLCLSLMAAQLETNTKYLRYIIKNYKCTDFTTYINELRVSYIINKMKTDPHYLQYKISYLGKEVGFTSHSRFTKTFKKLTDCTPSEFINKIKVSEN